MNDVEGLAEPHALSSLASTNVALGKPCRQSSLSEWSTPDEADQAVSGHFTADFAFHTDFEDAPWWQVDLGVALPIDAIVVHNRLDGFQSRARTLKVEIATGSEDWTLIHAGHSHFGAHGNALVLRVGGELRARYVRLSLEERQYFHLSQVEVLCRPDLAAFSRYCHRVGIPETLLQPDVALSHYALMAAPDVQGSDIVGLDISYSGRFGNLLHQYVNAIQIAKTTGLSYVRLGEHDLLSIDEPFVLDGIRYFTQSIELPADGFFIGGDFFNSDDFRPLLSAFLKFDKADEEATTAIVRDIIRPRILRGIPLEGEQHPPDEITIHLRSGDVFEQDHPIIFGYRQPPLSFYQLVVTGMMRTHGITRARLVFEDRGNPCVDALEQWLAESGIPYRVQCGTLSADLSALIDAPHLVFGHGTFGYAACRLSRHIRSLHYFAPELGGRYEFIPAIDEVFEVADVEGRYIRAYEYGVPFGEDDGWRNTPEMRQVMLDYPAENLAIRRCPVTLTTSASRDASHDGAGLSTPIVFDPAEASRLESRPTSGASTDLRVLRHPSSQIVQSEEKSVNEEFFEQIFPNFWENLDTSKTLVDDQSMFADENVFEWLIKTVRPREIIEIGSWKGHSANFIIDQCRHLGLDSRIVCVDTFLGGPEHWLIPGMIETLHRENGRPTILERFIGNTVARGNAGRVFPLTADSFAASEIFRHLNFKADLIFVDGAHDDDSVRSDIMCYAPRLSDTGVMFGDDYQHGPLAETVHACARELGVQVLVSARKWIFLNEFLMRQISLPNVQIRQSFEGWAHS